MLPLYILSALKTPAFKLLTNCMLDEKVYMTYKLLSMPISSMTVLFYPRLYSVSNLLSDDNFGAVEEETNLIKKPKCRPLRREHIHHTGCYLLDDGEYLNLILGTNAEQDFVQQIFGYNNAVEMRT
mmetsp:Transcript_48786/g.66403  ORF Transcript_48786/g.66403 Transcript_48786/m.66403 type:complete len:126 (+) Transcript_48786:376-753(+)